MSSIEKFKKILRENYCNNEVTVENEKIKVGGSLDLRGTNITELPSNLTVGDCVIGLNNENIVSVKKLSNGYNKERKYIYFDGILWGNVKSVKKKGNIIIYKTPLGYCVVENKLSAHGKTLKQAMEDLTFKKLKDIDTSEIVKEIKKIGKITRMQYRAITGACQMGTEAFCSKHNITVDEISLKELRKILTTDNYGAERFWKLIDEEES